MSLPEWWLEALLPGLVFGTLFVVWVVLPGRAGEVDVASRIRDRLRRR